MRFFVFLLCFVFSFNSFAQKTRNPRVLFKVAPLALLDDVSFPTIQGGVEVALNPRISWYNEFGIGYRNGREERVDTSFVSAHGFKVKSELRYYWLGRTDEHGNWMRGHYVAVNFYYSRNLCNSSTTYYYQNDSTNVMKDCFGLTKSIWGTNIIIGRQTELGKRFLVDIYAGLGTRFRNFVAVNKEYDPERDELKQQVGFTIYDVKSNNEAEAVHNAIVNISLGIRVAFRLY